MTGGYITMRSLFFIILLGLFCPLGIVFPNSDAGKTEKIPLRAKAGAYYFDGWTTGSPHITERLKTEFGDREPVWGWNDDTLQIVEQQIDYAADGGLAFFAFDWYYPEGPEKKCPLNTGLNLYLKARNRTRLEFCLLVANHSGFRIGPKDWDAVCDIWTELFKQPTHLKIDGKPLIIFFSARELLNSFETTDTLKSAFNRLREKTRSAGLEGVQIAACATPGPRWDWDNLNLLASAGFDCFTGYNYHGHPKKGAYNIQEYAWNENGEGGYLTPLKSTGATYLNAVHDALLKP
jgi:hypothetical protein